MEVRQILAPDRVEVGIAPALLSGGLNLLENLTPGWQLRTTRVATRRDLNLRRGLRYADSGIQRDASVGCHRLRYCGDGSSLLDQALLIRLARSVLFSLRLSHGIQNCKRSGS